MLFNVPLRMGKVLSLYEVYFFDLASRMHIVSESQKGINAVQCFFENQKALSLCKVYL